MATLFGDKSGGAINAAEKAGSTLEGLGITILLKFVDVLIGVGIIIAGLIAVKFIKAYFAKIETTHEQQKTAINLLEKITSGFAIVVAITMGLKVMGLDLTFIVGVITLGLSFGLRDVIKNYVAGLLILFKAPFSINDVVKIRQFLGRIKKIEFQSITLQTFDGKEITIHNSDLLTQPLINYSKLGQMRMEFSASFGYGSDMQKVLKMVNKILEVHPMVLKTPKYSIVFKQFHETSIDILIRFWLPRPCNPLKIRSELALQIQESFDEENIFTPYAREEGLPEKYTVKEGRKERIKIFYNQPMFAEALADNMTSTVPTVSGEFVDTEEPE